VLAFSNGKHYPLVKVHSGVDSRGQDITGLECDTVDEIEALLDRFDCDDMRSRKESRAEAVAELSFEDLYMVCRSKLGFSEYNLADYVSFGTSIRLGLGLGSSLFCTDDVEHSAGVHVLYRHTKNL